MTRSFTKIMASGAALASIVVLAACGSSDDNGDSVTGKVSTNGSSTVGPLTEAAGELFNEENPDATVNTAITGTGDGIKAFCAGETDIANASRPIKTGEKDEDKAEGEACKAAGIEYVELRVATDALSVVVSSENDFIECLTTDELNKLWEPAAEGKVTKWNQVNADFPAETIELFGPGTSSGTFDYFTDEITGEEGASRTDYNPSEDDNTLVTGVAGNANALGYFGYTYFEANKDKLKLVSVDSGEGCVEPSPETAADGSYTPLARPLFIYVNKAKYTDNAAVKAFVDFYVENASDIAEKSNPPYIGLNDDQQKELEDAAGALAG